MPSGPWLILFLPLLAAAVICFGLHRQAKASAALSIAAVWAGFFIAASFLPDALAGGDWSIHESVAWMRAGGTTFSYGTLVDGLSLVMLLVVTGVGGLIHVYSLGYMHGDPGFARFFACLSLFIFSMLGIVLADNFFQIFIHWELVGVSSYLLIGYYYRKPSASAAANKAFLTNRVGDFGFMLGILMLYFATGTADFQGMADVVSRSGFLAEPVFQVGGALGWTVTNEHFLWVAGALTLMGVMGKSAQFPLHVWLPDAMEGPTPVSALIHAATMVAAGVFLLARIFFIYLPSETAMSIVAHLGMFTAFFAATIATTQFDIKRILAFSTLSQLGYMVMAIGLGSTDVAMYHLTTHAFFKALLFLGAGSVIHAVHTNDIREMGGLIKKMPITSWLFLIGTLALCGVPPLSGFWSKDGILHLTHHPPSFADNAFIHWLPTITAVLTSYYMFRLFFMTFVGKPRYHAKPHESPATMWAPMAVLCVLAVLAGPVLFSADVIEDFRAITRPPGMAPFEHIHGDVPTMAAALLIFVLGAGSAWLAFGKGIIDPARVRAALGPIPRLFDNRWYVDDLYTWIVDNVQQNFARACDLFDRYVVIGLLVNGSAWLTRALGATSARVQSGSVRTYALIFVAGVAALLALNLYVMLETNILTLLVAIPALATLVLFFVPAGARNVVRTLSVVGSGLTVVLAGWLFFAYDQDLAGFQFLQKVAWVPELGISYQVGVDGISVAMVMLTSVVYLAGALVSCSVEKRSKDFYILLNALVAGVFGVFVSLDLFFFYFFYELAVVPMYLLIGYWGSTNREYATMKLTLYLTAGAVVALLGLLMLYFSGITPEPTFDLLAIKQAVDSGAGLSVADQRMLFPILLVGFATIAPMWPLHTWSPGGHAAAPSAASMMHAGVLMKLGSYAIIRIAMPLLPDGAIAWLPWVAVLCSFNIIYGGLVAMNQKDMKFVIGYSSSSHMGYVLLGIASVTTLSVSGAVFLMFAHGIMTALAFSLIGFFYDQTHTRMLDDLGGLMQQIPFVGICFVMMAMASLGLPGFANFASELMVIVGSWEKYPIPTICALFGLVIGATYLLRTVRAAFLGEMDPRWSELKDATGPLQRAPFLLLMGTLLLFGIYPLPLVDLIATGVEPLVQTIEGAAEAAALMGN